ncbi:MAG TPA: aldehyde dehydrogenase family protein [Gemmatimonadales bacterium]|nr:aldehyde dehydrogenase family protein [Gemmatimonadales bacterium]
MSIAGEQRAGAGTATIRAPYDGAEVGIHPLASAAEMDAAVAANLAAAEACRRMPAYERAACLRRVADGIETRRDDFARLLAREAGKPIAQARLEIERATFVFRDGAEEATRIGGEVLPLDALPSGRGRVGLTRRFPLAPIAAITPFNFPVLLAAHKLAPAMACGASLTLKPPPQDPLTTLLLGELVAASGYPAGGVNIVPCELPVAQQLIRDERVRMISFTGSAGAGWAIRAQAGTKRVALELGGNAAAIVERDADLALAVERCAAAGYSYAGQACISLQRILAQERVYAEFLDAFTARVGKLKVGDPMDAETYVGPMISEAAAERAEQWIADAVKGGAQIAAGGRRHGALLEPTVLTGTRPDQQVNCEEVFAPVTTVTPYGEFEDALQAVNASRYGLQAGVFTRDIARMMRAWDRLDVGGVMGNEVPTWRVDRMPYGGTKASGVGREGVRFAIEEMTELRLLTLSIE